MKIRIIREPHPLGFSKYGVQAGRVQVVAHVWKQSSSDRDVHDHRFSFRSLVARGKMTERLWEPVPGVTHDVVEWKAGPDGKSREVASGRTCGLTLAGVTERKAGTWYQCRAGEFHSVTVTRAPLVTLLIKVFPVTDIPYATVIRQR